MANHLIHTDLGRATIVSSEEVIEAASQYLKDLDSFELEKEKLIAEFVMVMNSALSPGKKGAARQLSENEVMSRLIGISYMLKQACSDAKIRGAA